MESDTQQGGQDAPHHSFRTPFSPAWATKGISEHTPLCRPLHFWSRHPLLGTRTFPFWPGFLLGSRGHCPRYTCPVGPKLCWMCCGWRQAEGPFKGGIISSARPEPPNHSSPTPDSFLTPAPPVGAGRDGEAAGRGGLGQALE